MDNQEIMTTAEAVMETVEENVNAKGSNVGSAILSYGLVALATYGAVNLVKRGYKWAKNKLSKRNDSEADVELAIVETDEVEESK